MTCAVPKSLRRVYSPCPDDVTLTEAARLRHPRAAFWCHTTRRGYRSIVICYLCDRLVTSWNGGSAPPPAVATKLTMHRIAEALPRLPRR